MALTQLEFESIVDPPESVSPDLPPTTATATEIKTYVQKKVAIENWNLSFLFTFLISFFNQLKNFITEFNTDFVTIEAVHDNKQNIDTVADEILRVATVANNIDDVVSVADNIIVLGALEDLEIVANNINSLMQLSEAISGYIPVVLNIDTTATIPDDSLQYECRIDSTDDSFVVTLPTPVDRKKMTLVPILKTWDTHYVDIVPVDSTIDGDTLLRLDANEKITLTSYELSANNFEWRIEA